MRSRTRPAPPPRIGMLCRPIRTGYANPFAYFPEKAVRTTRETAENGRISWTDVCPNGYGVSPPAAEIYVHMRARPLIAVTTSELRRPEDVVARPQGEPPKLEVALATLYPEAIERAGGIPVIVPLLRPDAIDALLDRVDGVCLPGGPDLQPSTYGQAPHPELGPTEPRVDA